MRERAKTRSSHVSWCISYKCDNEKNLIAVNDNIFNPRWSNDMSTDEYVKRATIDQRSVSHIVIVSLVDLALSLHIRFDARMRETNNNETEKKRNKLHRNASGN